MKEKGCYNAFMKKWIKRIIVLLILLLAGYYFRAPIGEIFLQLRNRFRPCSAPIAYDLGSLDSRFDITRQDFIAAIYRAEEIWEKPTQRDLFRLVEGGGLKISLIYDNRQKTTEQLQVIDSNVDVAKRRYDELEVRYNELTRIYEAQQAAFEAKLADFNKRQSLYGADVDRSNKRGGASKELYQELQARQESFRIEANELERERVALVTAAEQVNVLIVELNSLARKLNLNVEKYNTLGASLGEEFTEGVYKNGPSGREIVIYQYDNQSKLVRVLAHELGHALGLGHVEDPKAIMYRLNAGINERLTTTDIDAINAHCSLK